jgi:hypothetical protein
MRLTLEAIKLDKSKVLISTELFQLMEKIYYFWSTNFMPGIMTSIFKFKLRTAKWDFLSMNHCQGQKIYFYPSSSPSTFYLE